MTSYLFGRHRGPCVPSANDRIRVAILVEELLARLVVLMLRHIDADCRIIGSERELRALMRESSPDVLIADLDKYDAADRWSLSARGKPVPWVGMTRTRETKVKLAAFERGAYDVIEGPFTPDEVVVRTMASYVRAHGRQIKIHYTLRLGPFEVDLLAPGVRVDSTFISLSPLEQALLYMFLANPGVTLTREAILTNIWGLNVALSSNVIDRHIRDLRVKLGERWRTPRFIETVAGKGYRFIGDGGGSPDR